MDQQHQNREHSEPHHVLSFQVGLTGVEPFLRVFRWNHFITPCCPVLHLGDSCLYLSRGAPLHHRPVNHRLMPSIWCALHTASAWFVASSNALCFVPF